jgi:phosphohistidine phosphatase
VKTLYIVRHAKSYLKEPGIPDHERPLLEKGKKRTKRIIDFLLLHRVKPDIILSSSARRAIETANFVAKGLNTPKNRIKSLSYFYKIDSQGIINEFMDFSDKYKSVMIIGHNPAVTNFVNLYLNTKIDSLPTSGVVCIKFNTQKWEEIETSKFSIGFVIYPAMLKKV